ncbi:hypothetical protein FQN50_006197 [Emmonsiellopsis sp. PD_5]|nr:hypothetical protein FQN50_006197 [Emmonsiellopsis sp. PD_5]
MAASPPLPQPPIHSLDLDCRWNGEPHDPVKITIKVEFTTERNTKLRLVDLNHEYIRLSRFDSLQTVKELGEDLPDENYPPADQPVDNAPDRESPDENSPPTDQPVDDAPDRESPVPTQGAKGGVETPRTLYTKGMKLPESAGRRLFPPSPSSTISRKQSFEPAPEDDEPPPVASPEGVELVGHETEANAEGKSAPPSISEKSDVHSVHQSFGSTQAKKGDTSIVESPQPALKESSPPVPFPEFEDRRSSPSRSEGKGKAKADVVPGNANDSPDEAGEPSSTSSPGESSQDTGPQATKRRTPSQIPVMASRSNVAGGSQQSSRTSSSEGRVATSGLPHNDTTSPSALDVSGLRKARPSLVPSHSRHERVSPVRLSTELPGNFAMKSSNSEPPESPKREGPFESKRPAFFPSLTTRNSDPEQPSSSSPPALKTKSPPSALQKLNSKAEEKKSSYVSTWLDKNDAETQEQPSSSQNWTSGRPLDDVDPLLFGDGTEDPAKGSTPVKTENTDPAAGREDEMVSFGKDSSGYFHISMPRLVTRAVCIVSIYIEVTPTPLQEDGWQLLHIPGFPLNRNGKFGTFRLLADKCQRKKKIECSTEGLVGGQAVGGGCMGSFNAGKPLVLKVRGTEVLTSESIDKRILDCEIRVAHIRRRILGLGSFVEYTAIIKLSTYQQVVCQQDGAFMVVISDGPRGDFEFRMEGLREEYFIDVFPKSASHIGTTKIKVIWCTELESEKFRLRWRTPHGTTTAFTWVPKLFFVKVGQPIEYTPSLLRSRILGLRGGRHKEATVETQETTVKTQETMIEQDDEDWDWLGLPYLEDKSVALWIIHQALRVCLLFLYGLEALGSAIRLYFDMTPMALNVGIVSLFTGAILLHLTQPSWKTLQNQVVRFDYRPSRQRGWIVSEKDSITTNGLEKHLVSVICGEECTGPGCEDCDKMQETGFEDTQITVPFETPSETAPIAIGSLPFTSYPQARLHNAAVTLDSQANAAPTKISLRDRIDVFLGWRGLEA